MELGRWTSWHKASGEDVPTDVGQIHAFIIMLCHAHVKLLGKMRNTALYLVGIANHG